jgi:hypothetical protein
MVPTLSWMLSEAGASLMGQVAVLGAGAVGAGSCTGASSSAAAGAGVEDGTSPSAPRWISTALGSDKARSLTGTFPHRPRLEPDLRLSPHPAQHFQISLGLRSVA